MGIREWQDLTSSDVQEMIVRLDMKRKSRVWFGDDTDCLNALCAAQDALEEVRPKLVLAELRQARRTTLR